MVFIDRIAFDNLRLVNLQIIGGVGNRPSWRAKIGEEEFFNCVTSFVSEMV